MSDETPRRAYPLQWPIGRPRTKYRQTAAFSADAGRRRLTVSEGARRVKLEVGRLGAANLVISTNVKPRGLLDTDDNMKEPGDVGAAVYFLLDGRQHCLACDKWNRTADNLAAIAAHVEATRGQLRWGVADSLAQAFAGFAALPPMRGWWEVLGVGRLADRDEVKRRHRELAALYHPDRGGDADKMADVNDAFAAFERERG